MWRTAYVFFFAVLDPAAAPYEIRQQFGRPAARFDFAFAVLRYNQGAADESRFCGEGALGLALEVEVVQKAAEKAPGLNVVLNGLRTGR
jgi:hypothetical protein